MIKKVTKTKDAETVELMGTPEEIATYEQLERAKIVVISAINPMSGRR